MRLIATKETGNYLLGCSVEQITLTKDPSVNKHPAEIGEYLITPCHMFHSFPLHSNGIQLHAADCVAVTTGESA